MKNLKIAGKILFSFAIVILATIVLGVSSLIMVRAVGNLANKYAAETVPSVYNLWIVRRAALKCEEYVMEATIVMTPEELEVIENGLAETRETMTASMNALVATMPEFEDEIAEFIARLQAVNSLKDEIFVEARKFTVEGNTAAYNLFHNEYSPAFEHATDVLLDMNTQLEDIVTQRYYHTEQLRLQANIIVVAVLIIAVAVAVIMTVRLTKRLNKPIVEIEEAMEHVSSGNFHMVSISYESEDELGHLADSVRATVEKLGIITESLTVLCDEIGRGDFGTIPKNFEAFTGDYGKILGALRTVRDNLNNTLLQIEVSSEQVLSGSEQVADGAQALAQGATEQASSVEELLASMNELLMRVKNNADHANRAKLMSVEADKCVTESNRIMGELMTAMDEINAASNQISKVIKSIDDIAFQTNILALNAAVEAARAGAAGKGFAVVADEVRSLAGKSAEAVQTTTALIQNTLNAISKGSQLATSASEALATVISRSAVVGQSVDEIAVACNEQQDAVDQMTIGVEQISAVVQTTSATAEESAAASEELSGQANMLKDMLSKFVLITDLSIPGEEPIPVSGVDPTGHANHVTPSHIHNEPAAYVPSEPVTPEYEAPSIPAGTTDYAPKHTEVSRPTSSYSAPSSYGDKY